MEGKWFAEPAKHAVEWGRRFYGEESFHILETKVPVSYVEKLFSNPNLDLDELNRMIQGINEYIS